MDGIPIDRIIEWYEIVDCQVETQFKKQEDEMCKLDACYTWHYYIWYNP